MNAHEYLTLHELVRPGTTKIYVATPLDQRTGGTVLRQQIRALNLGYALYEQNKNEVASHSVAIIGGGFAGLTLAAGLLRRGFEVHLFEQRPELCHLQSGCEIRALHPAIYDWPHPASTRRDAQLPLLNWSAGTAGDIARSVLRQFSVITKNSDGKYNEYLGANAKIDGDRVTWDNAADAPEHRRGPKWRGRGGTHKFDSVFLTVGFGIERGVSDATTVSYWRNDRFGQPQPGARSERPESVMITGTGDGALVDLIRTCVRGYKQDALIDDFFGDVPRFVDALGTLRKQLIDNPEKSVLAAVQQLCDNAEFKVDADKVEESIRKRRRHDTHVVLNGREHSLDKQITLRGRSFLNVVIACLLYKVGAYSYVGGKINTDGFPTDGVVSIEGYGTLQPDQTIARHGTDREAILESAGLTSRDIQSLKERQAAADGRWQLRSLWPPGWWAARPNEAPDDNPTRWTEKIPRTELVAATLLEPIPEPPPC